MTQPRDMQKVEGVERIKPARVTICGSLRGEDWWAVSVTTERGRAIWGDYQSRQEAEQEAAHARSYYRRTARGVEGAAPTTPPEGEP